MKTVYHKEFMDKNLWINFKNYFKKIKILCDKFLHFYNKKKNS